MPPRVCKQYPEEFTWQKLKIAHPCGESPSSSNEIQFRDRMQMDADSLRQITAHSSYALIHPTCTQQSQNSPLHSSDSTSFSHVIYSASKKHNNTQISSYFSPQPSSSSSSSGSLSTGGGCDAFFFNQYRGVSNSKQSNSNNPIGSPQQFANFSVESRQPFNSNKFMQLRQQQSLNKHYVKINQKTDSSPGRDAFNFTEDEVNQLLQQDSISLGHTRLEAQDQSQILEKSEKFVVGESQQRSMKDDKRQYSINEVQRHSNSLAKFTSSLMPQSDCNKMNQQLATFSANSYLPVNGIFTRFSSQQSSVDRTTNSYPSSSNHPSFFKATADGSNSLRPIIPRICSKQRLHTMSLVQSTSASRLGSPSGINRSKNISIDFPTICGDSIADIVKESLENRNANNNLHLLREPRSQDRAPPQNVLKLPIISRDNSLANTKTLTYHHRNRSTQLFSIPQSIIQAIVTVPMFSEFSLSTSIHQSRKQQQPQAIQPSRSLDEEVKTETQQESPAPLPPRRDIKTPSFNTRANKHGTQKYASESANKVELLSNEMNSSFGMERLKQLPSSSILNQGFKGETATKKGSFNTSRIAAVARNKRALSKHQDEPVFVPLQLKEKPILSAVPSSKEVLICLNRRISLSTQANCAKESKPTKVVKNQITPSISPVVGTLNLSKITSYRLASLNSTQRRHKTESSQQQKELSFDDINSYKVSQLNQVNSLAS